MNVDITYLNHLICLNILVYTDGNELPKPEINILFIDLSEIFL